MKKSWYAVNRAATGAAVTIYGDIGDFGITAADFHKSLAALGNVREIALNIDSPGGDVATGFSIYNMLKRHPARVVATVDGLAASMASVIVMAADRVIMPANAMLMIHNPLGVAMGGPKELASFAEAVAMMRTNIANAYVSRTGISQDEIFAMMDRETWLGAQEAVEKGFADEVEEPRRIAAHFDLSKFKNAPQAFARHDPDNPAARWDAMTRAVWAKRNGARVK
jgi:ATP-dependent Clp protease protease subunit